MAAKLGNSMMRVLGTFVIAGCILSVCFCSCNRPASEKEPVKFDETNPMGANAACYVCHIPFVKEELSKSHLRAKVTCVRCHGLSAGHANDEDIGATPPDVSFGREQVDAMCLECHQRHDIADKAPATAICTDCHGKHRIKSAGTAKAGGNEKSSLFVYSANYSIQ